MKVLLINSLCGRGSTGRIVEGIADVLIASGHDAKIAYSLESSENPIAFRFGSGRDHFIHRVMSHAFDMQGLCSKSATKKLIKFIDNYKPDIVNLHNIHGNYLNYPLLFSYLSKKKIKTVWTLHDCWSFTGHCPHFVFYGCEKWKTECHSCPQLNMYPASNFWDGSKRNYQIKKECFTALGNKLTIVTVSAWLGSLVKQSFLGYNDVKVIHNGINLDLFKPATSQDNESIRKRYMLGKDKIILAVASPFSKRKGFDDLIKLASLLPDGYRLMMVGLNEEQLNNLPEYVVGIKRTESTTELALIYSVSSVFVNATYEDCFPTVNLEALGCGTPIVTYRTGGSPEAIDNQTGIVVEQGDIKGLLQAIEKICSTETKKSDICRDKALKNFSASLAFRKYVELFEELARE